MTFNNSEHPPDGPAPRFSARSLPFDLSHSGSSGTFDGTVAEGENGRLIVVAAIAGRSFFADVPALCDFR